MSGKSKSFVIGLSLPAIRPPSFLFDGSDPACLLPSHAMGHSARSQTIVSSQCLRTKCAGNSVKGLSFEAADFQARCGLSKQDVTIDKRHFFKVAITHELPDNRLLGLPLKECRDGTGLRRRLTCSCAHQRVCYAISRAIGKASLPSRSLRPQASCRARRNPVSPPSTNLSQGSNGTQAASCG